MNTDPVDSRTQRNETRLSRPALPQDDAESLGRGMSNGWHSRFRNSGDWRFPFWALPTVARLAKCGNQISSLDLSYFLSYHINFLANLYKRVSLRRQSLENGSII
jgi:hypothetical protein